MAGDNKDQNSNADAEKALPEASGDPTASERQKDPGAVSLGRRGGRARAARLTPNERRQAASKAAVSRWARTTAEERSEAARKAVAARWAKQPSVAEDDASSEVDDATADDPDDERSDSGSGKSGRRFASALRDAGEHGYLHGNVPGFNAVNGGFRQGEDMTDLLKTLIGRSALPMRTLETSVGIDSSGIGTKVYVRHFDVKHGKETRTARFCKVHCAVGPRSHAVLAANVSAYHSGDAPELPGLVEQLAPFDRVTEVSADKAYCTFDAIRAIDAAGMDALIPMKINSKEHPENESWSKLWALFTLERERFLNRYHSSRESTEAAFSGLKRIVRSALRARTDRAMMNESLAMIVAWNLTRLNHMMFKHGITADFLIAGNGRADYEAPLG